MLILTHLISLVPREDHAGNTSIPHIYIHRWKAHMQPQFADDVDLMGAAMVNFKTSPTDS